MINGDKEMFNSISILGVKVHLVSKTEALDAVFSFFNDSKLNIIHTINPEFILNALEDEEYRKILNSASLAVADGIGILKAAKYQHVKVPERIGGCDLAQDIMDKMQGTHWSVFILGASQNNLDAAIKNLKIKFPGLDIAGSHNGYFTDSDDETIINEINESKANLLLVGMGGIKKQETWVYKYRDKLNVQASMGIGGSIDVYSGNIKRAPLWMQRFGLEWLFRTLQEPKKRLKRIYKIPLFLWLALKEQKNVKRSGLYETE